jgi:hypothetical protein
MQTHIEITTEEDLPRTWVLPVADLSIKTYQRKTKTGDLETVFFAVRKGFEYKITEQEYKRIKSFFIPPPYYVVDKDVDVQQLKHYGEVK